MKFFLLIVLSLPAVVWGEVSALGQAELQKAFRALLAGYAEPGRVSALEVNRAALEGVLARVPGVELVDLAEGEQAPEAASSPSLFGHPYLLVGRGWEEELGALPGEGVLIVDLRAGGGLDFGGAAALVSALGGGGGGEDFQIGGKPSRRGGGEPIWKGECVLLVDADTAGAAEVAARVLRARAGCLVVGARTAGLPCAFTTEELRPGLGLRFAHRALEKGGGSFLGRPLEPDVAVAFDAAEKGAWFGRTEGIFDLGRPRRSEASLMAGEDPEIPFELGKEVAARPAFDPVLARAADLLAAAAALDLKERVRRKYAREARLEATRRRLEELEKEGG